MSVSIKAICKRVDLTSDMSQPALRIEITIPCAGEVADALNGCYVNLFDAERSDFIAKTVERWIAKATA